MKKSLQGIYAARPNVHSIGSSFWSDHIGQGIPHIFFLHGLPDVASAGIYGMII